MNNSLQATLEKLVENQASPDEIDLLRNALTIGQIFIGGNVHNSVIIVGSGNSVQLSPEALDRLSAANNLSALHQLPQPPTDFVGREEELRNILTNIEEKKGASISGLTGMGGIGKTALGLVAAHELVTKYSDAQFFIDLRGTTKKPLQPVDVMKHVVQSVYPTADLRNTTESELAGLYHSVLSEKKAILFLDNVADAGQVIPLLPPPSSCVFITSRWQFPVPGLNPLRLDVLKEESAIQLLIDLCPRITQENAKKIASLCGYLPIALRLAGGYLQVNRDWTPEEYIAQLSKKNEKIKTLYLERSELNIDSIFSLSYQRLTRGNQKYWSMLAVFPTSFDRSAIGDVWNLNDEKTHKIASKLCQYSLMEYDSITKRYHLHDLLTDFANKKSKEPNKGLSLYNYLVHYHKVWLAAEEQYTKGGENITQGLLNFDTEYRHISTAYEWAIEKKDTNHAILSVLKEIPNFVYLARIRLHSDQQIKWFEASLDAAQKLDDKDNQNKALGNIGVAYDNLGEYHKAIGYYEQAWKIASEIGDHQRQGIWLGNIGGVYVRSGENRKAIKYLEQSLEIAREIGDRQRQGFWLGNIGSAYLKLGDYDKAIEYMSGAQEIAREIGDRQRQGSWLGNIGSVYVNLGELRKAIEYYEQALGIAREIGDRQRYGLWFGNIGVTYANLGENHKAINHLEQSLKIALEIGDRQHQGLWLGNIGFAYDNLGEYHKAIGYYEQALEIANEVSDHQRQGSWLGKIGNVYVRLGENHKAVENLRRALELAKEFGDQQVECECLISFGELYIRMQEVKKAQENFESALAISKKLGIREQEAKCIFNYAKLSQLENKREAALQYAQESRTIFESIESPQFAEVIQFIESLN